MGKCRHAYCSQLRLFSVPWLCKQKLKRKWVLVIKSPPFQEKVHIEAVRKLWSFFSGAWSVSRTKRSITFWGAVQIPRISAASSTIIGVISKRQCPCGNRVCTPSTAALAGTLTLRASFCFFKADSTNWFLYNSCNSRFNLPSIFTATTSAVRVISKRTRPRWGTTPIGTRASGPLALWASFCFSKAEAILFISSNVMVCLNLPLIPTASRSLVSVISKWLSPRRIWTPTTAAGRWSLALWTAFGFSETNPEPILGPRWWQPADDVHED